MVFTRWKRKSNFRPGTTDAIFGRCVRIFKILLERREVLHVEQGQSALTGASAEKGAGLKPMLGAVKAPVRLRTLALRLQHEYIATLHRHAQVVARHEHRSAAQRGERIARTGVDYQSEGAYIHARLDV
ncbi:MAG TPA: hypothetical protein VGN11_12750 [Candidatus Baltobacteraceae bacterium]|nr:hypothetical protein [Candidatus Baltobacteraceae bacterium]